MAIQVFGAGAVQTAYVSYETIDLSTGSVTLVWPNSYVNLPYTSGGITYNVLAASMEVTATANSNTLTLPDLSEFNATVGSNFIIKNSASDDFNLLYSDGSPFLTIADTLSYWVQLTDNSTSNGTWNYIQFGAGTSQAQASALVGLGLTTLGGDLLNANIPIQSITTVPDFTTDPASYRATLFIWQGGSEDNFQLPSVNSVPAGYFFSLNIESSASVIILPNSNDPDTTKIDSQTSITLITYQSLTLITDGADWWTLGLGQNTLSNSFGNGLASAPSITFTSDPYTGIYYNSATPYLGFSVRTGTDSSNYTGIQVGEFTTQEDNTSSTFSVISGTNAINIKATADSSESVISCNAPLTLSLASSSDNSVYLYNGLEDNTTPVSLKLSDPTNTYYVGFHAGALTRNTGYTFPEDGELGQLLQTNGSGTLSWVTAAGTGTVTSITAGTGLSGGTINTSGTISLSTPVSLANGGTGASLTASNGGIFYSTASAAAILSGTSTSNQVLLSGASSAPAWSASTLVLAGNFSTAGAYSLNLTTTATTNVTLPTSGKLISALSTGGAATSGQATLDGTTGVMISTTAVKTTSIILVTHSTGASSPTLSNLGNLVVGSISDDTSFMVYSSNALDMATVSWQIINS